MRYSAVLLDHFLSPQDIELALGGLPDDRRHVATVAAGALRAATLDDLHRQDGRESAGELEALRNVTEADRVE